MKRILIIVLTSFSFSFLAQALPHPVRFDARQLQITWEVVENSYQGKAQFLTSLTLTNKGRQPFPARGWKLYYNYSKTVIVRSGALRSEFLNGDLNRLVPGEAFKAIPADSSHRLTLIASGRALNVSDVPAGFYLVWEEEPAQGWPVAPLVIKPVTGSAVTRHPVTPAMVFRKNLASQEMAEDKLPRVFPSPASYRETGQAFTLTAKVAIHADGAFRREAQLLAQDLGEIFGQQPPLGGPGEGPAIRLQQVANLGPEAYQLQVSARGIVIRASAAAGAFYGTQSLKTMLPAAAWDGRLQELLLPGVEVSDAPRFGYRGFMMDVARNFQDKGQVLRILDLMALYKLNVLHLHLNDDEGWRLEIPSLPELTQVGALRGHSADGRDRLPPSYGSGPEAGNMPGSGFYSKADFVEILRYARDRHIRVIPEVETPGHARAALRAMDFRYERLRQAGKKAEAERYLLRDLQDKSVYRSVQRWNDNVMNVALPATYAFLETVIDEILGMYREAGAPISTLHVGGDEVPAGVWKKSPAVAALLQSQPQIKQTEDLWYYYFGRVNDMLQARHLHLSGWEEVALRKSREGGKIRYNPNPDFVKKNFQAYVWNNVWGWGSEDLAYRLANAGYKVILAPVTHLYLDMAYYQDFAEPGLYWGAFIDVDKPFSFVPLDYYKSAWEDLQGKPVNPASLAGKERLSEAGKANIVGLQCQLWGERVFSPERQEYMLLPKILGFAERAWAPDPTWAQVQVPSQSEAQYQQAWALFVNVLARRELPRLDRYKGGYHYRIPTAGALVENGRLKANVQFPGWQIRYTTDGTEPTLASKLYRTPLAEKGLIRLKVFSPAGRSGRSIEVFSR